MTPQEDRIAEQERMAVVRALREAADAWVSDHLPPRRHPRPQLAIQMVELAADYLHARADEIEAQP